MASASARAAGTSSASLVSSASLASAAAVTASSAAIASAAVALASSHSSVSRSTSAWHAGVTQSSRGDTREEPAGVTQSSHSGPSVRGDTVGPSPPSRTRVAPNISPASVRFRDVN
eukprot:1176011-Prorocentrum_minimum.AAC.7